MKTKSFSLGDKVELKTRTKAWKGNVLDSHDPEVILLKLKSGYNIGIREGEILNAKVLERFREEGKEKSTQEKNAKLKNIAMIVTGGTISSRLDPKTGGVISTDKEELLKIAPEINHVANIVDMSSPFLKFSEDMNPKDWIRLAQICEKKLNDKNIDGLIITHGTDTLHYTAAALAFFLRDLNKPIALTYSQRSIDRGSTDAALNLLCAAKYAISDIAQVALIGHKDTNDETCLAMPATRVRKMHTSKRETFQVINGQPLAEITKENFRILSEFSARDNKRKVIADTAFCESVTSVKIHPGQNPAILDYYAKEGYKGIILEVTGLGQVPGSASKNNWITKIKTHIKKGMHICATPQTIFGRLNPRVYSSGRALQKTGIIFLEDMLSETALVKLGWVLGHNKWDPKEAMLNNIAGEISSE